MIMFLLLANARRLFGRQRFKVYVEMMPFNKNLNWHLSWFSFMGACPNFYCNSCKLAIEDFENNKMRFLVEKVLLTYPRPVDFSQIGKMQEKKNIDPISMYFVIGEKEVRV
jgi:hypothetical protein